MERKLASIQEIKEINPIENADSIERATILGWSVVVGKGEFKPGELVIYCEVDSLLPIQPEFEFLRRSCFNSRLNGFRIKTAKLRGQISQGIVFPVNMFSNILNNPFDEGLDVTDAMGIKKYEAEIPTCLSGQVKGGFPSFIPQTDETRIQAIPDLLNRYSSDVKFIATEKMDGTSATYFVNDGVFGVCGRNWELKETKGNTYWQVARKYNIEEALVSLGQNIAIQGEIVGPGIQGNKYGFSEHKIFFFNAFDIDNYKFYNFDETEKIFLDIEFSMVPAIGEDLTLPENFPDVESAVKYSIGKSIYKDTQREGIVVRPYTETNDFEIGRLSFKVINPKFLLKHNE